MSIETHRVLMGTCGWKHPSWLNDFYSEDLPEEWQLGFYANEFPVVYVPADDWLDADDISEWTEDVTDTFSFILEVPEHVLKDEADFVAAIDKAKLLDPQCTGLVFKLSKLRSDLECINKRLEIAKTVAPVCVDDCELPFSDEFKKYLYSQNVSEVWKGQETERDVNHSSLTICRITTDELDMMALRKAVEVSLSASTEDCISVLCFDGNPPSLEKLRNADTILNLL